MTTVETLLAEVLAAHWATTVDFGTPRQYTGHGGWNVSCACGHFFGSQDAADAALAAHVATEQAKALREAGLLANHRALSGLPTAHPEGADR